MATKNRKLGKTKPSYLRRKKKTTTKKKVKINLIIN